MLLIRYLAAMRSITDCKTRSLEMVVNERKLTFHLKLEFLGFHLNPRFWKKNTSLFHDILTYFIFLIKIWNNLMNHNPFLWKLIFKKTFSLHITMEVNLLQPSLPSQLCTSCWSGWIEGAIFYFEYLML